MTAIVAVLVAVAIIAWILDARRKRREAAANQRHSNVKPQPTFDQGKRMREGGRGDQGLAHWH